MLWIRVDRVSWEAEVLHSVEFWQAGLPVLPDGFGVFHEVKVCVLFSVVFFCRLVEFGGLCIVLLELGASSGAQHAPVYAADRGALLPDDQATLFDSDEKCSSCG